MIKTSRLFSSFIIVFFFSSGLSAQEEKTPNIVFINVDDLGYKDTEAYGSEFYETPHIKELAANGLTLTRGYAGAANCAPSRACLMSGLNTPRHEIYTVGNSDRGNKRFRKLVPTPNKTVLPDSIITIAEALKNKGYTTATFGKWHLGEDPKTQGFDVNVAGGKNGGPGKNGYFSPYNVPNMEYGPKGENLTNRLTDEAINFMKNTSGEPFFVYLPYYAVHNPLATFPELKDKYTSKKGNPFQNDAVYAGMIETVDTNICKILNYLKESGLLANTLIIFTSDNGGIADTSSQKPLRGGKGSYYEGGIRVPYIVRWDGVVAPNTRNETPISNLDIFPTLLEVAGIPVKDFKLDGVSLMPIFNGEKLSKRPLFFHFPIYLQAYNPVKDDGRDPLFRTRPGSVIIRGNWKLHQYFEDNSVELYNLNDDIGERNNLVQQHPEKTSELLQELNEWRIEMNAPIPKEKNPEYDEKFDIKKRLEYRKQIKNN
ncbi:sulfatase [Galbibacter mesophilus]|uniref:sulfatase n=1 Tax=Galbibacter mesophilus TaxID=379069 RepID=UPI00191D66ED|nr:sulfatase [Galbibacter mesophilus]MCM5664054.1 sulfatase [Galbibacter mesophilus]